MTEQLISDVRFEELAKVSKRGAIISFLGFLVVLGGMGYAAFNLTRMQREQQRLEAERSKLEDSLRSLESRTYQLVQTQEGVLDFLAGVTSGEKFRLLDPSVDWPRTKASILSMEAGPRKTAVLSALLLAWKNLPFSLSNHSLGKGLDSPHFLNVVLSSAGVHVVQRTGERLSDSMMHQFKMVDSPLPGDLIFYHGNVGSFVLMYVSPGSPDGKGVAVGTLQTGEEVMVLDTRNINIPVYPFIGFFRVTYPATPK